jgi:hypothetical protein
MAESVKITLISDLFAQKMLQLELDLSIEDNAEMLEITSQHLK